MHNICVRLRCVMYTVPSNAEVVGSHYSRRNDGYPRVKSEPLVLQRIRIHHRDVKFRRGEERREERQLPVPSRLRERSHRLDDERRRHQSGRAEDVAVEEEERAGREADEGPTEEARRGGEVAQRHDDTTIVYSVYHMVQYTVHTLYIEVVSTKAFSVFSLLSGLSFWNLRVLA